MKTAGPSSHQTIQRVKVGMVGLAAVILLIGLASAIFSAANRDRPVAVDPTNVAAAKPAAKKSPAVAAPTPPPPPTPPRNSADLANEPLAELGVAPSTDVNAAQPAGKR